MIDKRRAVFKDEVYVYAVDDVHGLGQFMEIERETDDEGETERIKDELKIFVEKIGARGIENKGYVQMYVEKYYPQLLK